MKQPCVYIMANRRHGTLYVGVTSQLPARVWQHKTGALPGFTSKYRLYLLVWYERHVASLLAMTGKVRSSR
jgi:putative endonuclease